METNEHQQVGDQIRIETLNNRYLRGSKNLSEEASNNLYVTMMGTVKGIPVPLDLELSAGDIVAGGGDYYTLAGWGLELEIPKNTGDVVADNKQLLAAPVTKKEAIAFRRAYDDLASPTVKESDIARIYAIENTRYIPFSKSLNDLVQQLVYSFTVKGYGNKLIKDEAHFAPWSLRAYIVGHQSALRMASLAFYFKKLAEGKQQEIPKKHYKKLLTILEQIKKNPSDYKLTPELIENNEALCSELSQRYHVLAVARDLFAMHFYSDHFAGGHMSRIGLLRKIMPDQFGTWGSILINNMHNEDNTKGVTVTNPFQPHQGVAEDEVFVMNPEDCQAYGDGTYFKRSNDENSNLLINGMDNSLGDIARLMQTGEKRKAQDFGGLTFLPEIDYTKPQPQPLLIQGPNGKVYFRTDVSRIKWLSPEAYKKTRQDPANNGYKKMTYFQACKLVLKLRLLGCFYSPKLEEQGINQEVVAEKDDNRGLSLDKGMVVSSSVFTGDHRNAPAVSSFKDTIDSVSMFKSNYLRSPNKYPNPVHPQDESPRLVASAC